MEFTVHNPIILKMGSSPEGHIKVKSNVGDVIKINTGVLPSLPDLRDYSDRHPKILPYAKILRTDIAVKEDLPDNVDLSYCFSPIEDQEGYGSCTAHAGVGLLEYMERRANGNHVDASRMFLYNATKWLLGWKGDTGAYLRTTMAALRLFGCPPEEYWKYDEIELDRQPTEYVMSLAANFRGLTYFRHDAGTNTPPECVALSMKKNLAAGIPSMFGFYGFNSFSSGGRPGDVPLPGPTESARWAHAVCAAGYDDNYEIRNLQTGEKTAGAFKLRNSWGEGWGDNGYGWIPYEFFYRRYCWDIWSILTAEWVETGEFGI